MAKLGTAGADLGAGMPPSTPHRDAAFDLVVGGPIHRLLRRIGLVRGDQLDAARQALAFVAVTWAPMMVLLLVDRLRTGHWEFLARDFSVHARLLVAVPLLFIGDTGLHVFTSHGAERFARGGFAHDARDVRRVIDGARRLRDALTPELVMLAAALTISQLLYWQGSSGTGIVRSGTGGIGHSPASFWYASVALPLAQFLFMRWIWRWFIWTRVIWQFSRLGSALAPLHPDRRGGVEFLFEAATGFAGGVSAFSAMQSGAWMSRVLYDGASAKEFLGAYWLLAIGALLFTHVPLLAWSNRLWHLRHDGAKDFGYFTNDYVRDFARKWLEGRPRTEEPLGSSDIQSLADLSNSFAIVHEIRLAPYSKRTLLLVFLAVTAPMIPVLLTEVPLGELLERLTSVALGKLGGGHGGGGGH